MLDIVLEVLRALISLGILVFFVRADKDVEYGRKGFLFIKIGFLLILFGSFVDITDNFESLNWAIVIGDTPVQAFLEKVVGYLGGFSMLAIGFWLWLPSIHRMGEVQKQLSESKRTLEHKVVERTKALEKEVDSRRVVEAALRQAEGRRKMLYEHAPVSITHGIITGNLVERNMAFARMLGYDSPEDLDRSCKEKGDLFYIWRDKEDFDSVVKKLKSEKYVRDFETRLLHKDGSIVLVRFNFTTLADRNGENYYFYGFADDITERKLAEDALAESEHRHKTIMDSLPAGVYLVDVSSQEIVDINPAALAMTGYDRDELVGKQCCENFCPKENGKCPVLDEGSPVDNREGEIRRKDGTELPIIKTVAQVAMDGREYLLEIFVDISEQKRLEHLKEDVDRIVRHDLKSPVIGMMNAASLLLMDEEAVKGETRKLLEVIQQQGDKVLRMIGMSLTMYKMEAGTYKYVPERVDFMCVVRRVLVELGEVANSKNTPVGVLLDGKEPGDEAVLPTMGVDLLYDSMLANLLKNAIEASPFGQPVELSLEGGEYPVVSITNSGAVSGEIRDVFFDKYVTSGKRTGSGLGTYSANLIVRTVGGSIEMNTSDDLDSTTVTVRLPGPST